MRRFLLVALILLIVGISTPPTILQGGNDWETSYAIADYSDIDVVLQAIEQEVIQVPYCFNCQAGEYFVIEVSFPIHGNEIMTQENNVEVKKREVFDPGANQGSRLLS